MKICEGGCNRRIGERSNYCCLYCAMSWQGHTPDCEAREAERARVIALARAKKGEGESLTLF